jgi:hypothetical protein
MTIEKNKNSILTNQNAWANNPVLVAGELGLDTNTNMLKVGDGVTAWAELPYLSSARWCSPGVKEVDDKQKDKLKDMLFLKYINMLREELGRIVMPSDLLGSEPSGWRTWMNEHGLKYSKPNVDHVDIPFMGGRTMYLSKNFAHKALVLGFLP